MSLSKIYMIKASYGGIKKAGSSTDFNPYFGTDYGICSIIKPQTAFAPEFGEDKNYWLKGLKRNFKWPPHAKMVMTDVQRCPWQLYLIKDELEINVFV